MKKQSLIIGAAIAGTLSSGMAFADVTSNIGFASTYAWRGQNLSGPAPVISGGVDYSHDSGLYAGIWVSSEGGATDETDYYAGFSGEASDLSYDVGFVKYAYNESSAADFSEAYVSVGFGPVSVGYNLGQDTAEDYLSVSAEYDIYSVTYGDYDTSGTHIDLGVTVGEVSLMYSMPSDVPGNPTDDPMMVVSWGKEFSL